MDLLRALETFVRVVETGSFSAVARETGTSHSAATRLIGQLEDHFGVRLFHRTTRRLSLTEDGQDLVIHARALIETTQEMEETLGRQRNSPTGLVRVGVPPAVATLLVPQLPALFQRYPGLSVELVVAERFGDLIEERLDLALQPGQPGNSSLIARTIGTFGRVLVASPIYLERRGAPREPADLAQHSCVIHERGPDSARWRFTGPDGPIDVAVTGRSAPTTARSCTAPPWPASASPCCRNCRWWTTSAPPASIGCWPTTRPGKGRSSWSIRRGGIWRRGPA